MTTGAGSQLSKRKGRARKGTIQDFTAEFDRLFLAEHGDDTEIIMAKSKK
jgi:hypothetical protein